VLGVVSLLAVAAISYALVRIHLRTTSVCLRPLMPPRLRRRRWVGGPGIVAPPQSMAKAASERSRSVFGPGVDQQPPSPAEVDPCELQQDRIDRANQRVGLRQTGPVK